MGEFLTVMQARDDVEGCITVSNSPNPSSVYIRLGKHRKKVFDCLNIAFLEKKAVPLSFTGNLSVNVKFHSA